MNKREFLKKSSIIGVASLLPVGRLFSSPAIATPASGSVCTLIPSETAGPFPLDLTTNNFYFRQDVRESSVGVQLNCKMKIIGDGNCLPMQNVRVNIWHCDKDGNYSGYGTETGLTYLRGYQMTDVNGDVEFITIFPGWYPGRICHIHFQVYVSSNYACVSQFAFDVNDKNAIYTANPNIYTAGIDPVSFANDSIFSDGYSLQIATLTPNAVTGGYDCNIEVTVQGTGTGIGHIEKQNAKNFVLGQNFPNPYQGNVTVPFYLRKSADVKLDLVDLNGKNVRTFEMFNLAPGDHQFELDMNSLNLAIANYAYQLEVKNSEGTYRDCKLMSASK